MRISNRPVGQTRRNSTRDSTQILCVKTASQSTRIRERETSGTRKFTVVSFSSHMRYIYIYTQKPPTRSLPIVPDTTIRIKIISRRQKRRPGISSLMKRELESLGLRGVAFPEREGEEGIGLPFERKLGVTKGGRRTRAKKEKRGKRNWKGETRSIYLLNVFRAFVGREGGGREERGSVAFPREIRGA